MTRLAATILACSLLLATAVVPSHAASLLSNGSFETWSGGYTPSNQPDRIFNDGSLAVSGWNFAIGLSSDLYRDKNATGATSNFYQAAQADYLAGSGSFGTLHEGISQSFIAAPSTWHLLTFKTAPGGLNYSASWIENATVGSSWKVDVTGAVPAPVSATFNNNLSDFNASGTTNPLVWTARSMYFKSDATGGSINIQFTAYGDNTHVFLDDVVLTETAGPPVPALGGPGAFVLANGLMLFAVWMIRRRRVA